MQPTVPTKVHAECFLVRYNKTIIICPIRDLADWNLQLSLHCTHVGRGTGDLEVIHKQSAFDSWWKLPYYIIDLQYKQHYAEDAALRDTFSLVKVSRQSGSDTNLENTGLKEVLNKDRNNRNPSTSLEDSASEDITPTSTPLSSPERTPVDISLLENTIVYHWVSAYNEELNQLDHSPV
ncbi:hypothetical protein JTE90_004844 [Oedothorax gibbosus]|uniref:Uncharacterized protein n=1 Tax=Oedothorax gibbosus TaxID=931172 RepID=A0AAV6USC6_9ARAC|nr:hypothetical protein JTE90_004844 [Oedothorax gibbosus]